MEGTMDKEQIINTAAALAKISQAELARQIGMQPSNFNQKVKKGTITDEELEKIAAVCGCTYDRFFTLPDGTKLTVDKLVKPKKTKGKK
jgi:transcriptional regulator with XRE-family HTH domain